MSFKGLNRELPDEDIEEEHSRCKRNMGRDFQGEASWEQKERLDIAGRYGV